MHDSDIRKVLIKELTKKYSRNKDTLLLEEVGIRHGIARIDLVVINSKMHGYEIKSDLDSLRRLPDQIRVFSSVMDRITLVVGYKHAYKALELVPKWWGVRLAEDRESNGNVVLADARSASNNPNIDLNSVVSLLWRNEALTLLEEIGAASKVRSKRRSEIYKRLVDSSDPEYLRFRIRQQLKSRRGWQVAVQQMSYDD